jgi:hypothetical protein
VTRRARDLTNRSSLITQQLAQQTLRRGHTLSFLFARVPAPHRPVSPSFASRFVWCSLLLVMGRKYKKARVVPPATSLEPLIELPPGRRVVRTIRACVVPDLLFTYLS